VGLSTVDKPTNTQEELAKGRGKKGLSTMDKPFNTQGTRTDLRLNLAEGFQ